MDLTKKSIELHKEKKGKIEIKSKFPLRNKEDLSIAYTPYVAEISKQISESKNKVYDYTIKKNTIAVISDGSAVLGLGNIGPEAAIPVMEGKCLLFKELANVDAFPICLNTQNPDEIIKTIKNISPVFGGINLEDIKAPNCFYIEERLKSELDIPVFHDDQHGTAIVILAALINSLKITNKKFEELRIVINGAGAAGIAFSKLITSSEFEKEFSKIKDIIVLDSKGIINRSREDLNEYKKQISQLTNKDNIEGNLENAIKNSDVFIGVSKGNLLESSHIESMKENPIIFALANPIPEIFPDKAKKAGAKIICTGRSDFPNQINNVLAFPGIFRGILDSGIKKINNNHKISAAKALSKLIQENQLNETNIIPDALNKQAPKEISKAINLLN